jgi:hypothetical protein
VLYPNDQRAQAVVAALTAAGYGSGSKKLPAVTGQDADLNSIKAIVAGKQGRRRVLHRGAGGLTSMEGTLMAARPTFPSSRLLTGFLDLQTRTKPMGIAVNIAGIADASRVTTEGITQSQTAVVELSTMAHELRRLVSQFQV